MIPSDAIFEKMEILKVMDVIYLPFARTTNYGLKQLRVNGPRIWNSLPTNIKNATSMHVFLKNLKVHFISLYC